ncbi:permease of the drug/metabolite transporter (DMT) superfamily [Yersinia enterocolitica]|nr:permease of the drug/metabolite transporter (DMT) superfamily [Yersinia enterocolitica]CNC86550.1 permease of the drug/metabolite transporter (DMT) superfamily [Yersinia enterocolitica]CND52630.1 permease of the drug/metabolite transporter (DMT) superfamily [Yersinia enterocolitica]CNE37546.1 permease of the drug/metabolite transporter (DMT) superfamily [Yersinia enterocolitica]CNF64478.1 permease of the drug/metabolite transporter (DMT) superfamily [Yersinia enterocolitica]
MVSVTWGTTWLAMKLTVETIPPIFATGIRFMLAAPVLILISVLTKTKLLFPDGQKFFQLFVCIFYFSIPFSLMIYGETYVSPALASIIFSSMPVCVLFFSWLLLNERVGIIAILGLVTSTVSLLAILFIETNIGRNNQWVGIISLVIAVIMHALVYVQCKKRSCSVSVLTFNAIPSLVAGILLCIVGWIAEQPVISKFSQQSLLSVIYLGIIAGVFGILCYFQLQNKASAFQASTVFLVFPIIALLLDGYVYGRYFSLYSILLIIPLLTGVLLISLRK